MKHRGYLVERDMLQNGGIKFVRTSNAGPSLRTDEVILGKKLIFILLIVFVFFNVLHT